MQAHTIDDVVTRLGTIIDWAHSTQSPLGYFAALYRKMTREVQTGIAAGRFDDNARMEHIGVVFANRYFAAFDRYQSGDRPTRAWHVAFEATKRWEPIVVQHLLLGMNAHINLDLGIAVARSVPPETLAAVQDDFNRINDILAHLIDQVQTELAAIWTFYGFLDRLTGRLDEGFINFSLTKAREQAWRVAQRLASLPEAEQEPQITALDTAAAHLATLVLRPGLLTRSLLVGMRLGERGSVADKIDILK
jgi:hypothetical protein